MTSPAQLARAALDLVVPQSCGGCERPAVVWCPACAAAVVGPALVVPVVGAPGVAVRAAAAYDGPAGRAVAAFKDNAARRLASPLGGLLASAVAASLVASDVRPGTPVWLVPVPSRRSAVRARGGEHMATLAGRAARELRRAGVPANRLPALRHVRAGRDQVGLGAQARRANVAGALAAASVPVGAVVVVDDVSTTGATIGEAIRALGAAGARPAGAAVVTWSVPHRHLASDPPGD